MFNLKLSGYLLVKWSTNKIMPKYKTSLFLKLLELKVSSMKGYDGSLMKFYIFIWRKYSRNLFTWGSNNFFSKLNVFSLCWLVGIIKRVSFFGRLFLCWIYSIYSWLRVLQKKFDSVQLNIGEFFKTGFPFKTSTYKKFSSDFLLKFLKL